MKTLFLIFALCFPIFGIAQGVSETRPGAITIPMPTAWQSVTPKGKISIKKETDAVTVVKTEPKTENSTPTVTNTTPAPDTEPPVLTFDKSYPFESAVSSVSVSGKASDKSGISFIGIERGSYKNFTDNSESFSFPVELNSGENSFTVKAKDKYSNTTEKKITITYKPVRNDYALLFYVSDYSASGLPNLNTTKLDAEKMAADLQKFGFQTFIFGNLDAEATKKKLEDFANKTYAPDDQLLIYFSGHGRKKTIGNNIQGDLICGKNSTVSHLEFLGLSDGNCNHVLLLTDACFSGIATQKTGGDAANAAFTKPAATRDDLIKALLAEDKTRKIITSGEDVTNTGADDGGSEFTLAFIAALKNAEQTNGILTIDQITKYMRAQKTLKQDADGSFAKDNQNSTFIFVKPAK